MRNTYKLLIVLGLMGLPPIASALLEDPALTEFREAYLAARTSESRVPAAVREKFEDHALAPYLEAADLRYRVRRQPSSATDRDARLFLRSHGEEPVARVMLGPWLQSLAKRGHWKTFLHYARDGMGDEIACNLLRARLRAGVDETLEADALKRWMRGSSQPPACDPVFAWLSQRDAILIEHRMTRIARAMKAGNTRLAKYLARPLRPGQRARVDRWIKLHKRPARELPRLLAGDELDLQLFAHGIRRLSRTDPGTTSALLDQFDERFQIDEELRNSLRRRIAISYAREHDPRAVAAFAALPTESDDHDVLEWRIRSAMLNGAWRTAAQWLRTLPPEMRELPKWRYWRARALEVTGSMREADALYRELAREHDYHAVLASVRLGLPYELRHAPVDREPLIYDALAARPDFQRAHLLYRAGLQIEASREWREATRDAPPEVLEQAATLARDWNWHSTAIATLARANHWDDMELRYPTAWEDTVRDVSTQHGLDPAWIYAVARSESLLAHDARSHAGAIGLMQLMPATARQVAKRLQVPYRGSNDLLEPELNLMLGSAYLSELIGQYDGHVMLAAAAYNAGPHRVARWLPNRPVDADVWVENIPFNETRGYVGRVIKHAAGFRWRLAGKAEMMPSFAPVHRVAAN